MYRETYTKYVVIKAYIGEKNRFYTDDTSNLHILFVLTQLIFSPRN